MANQDDIEFLSITADGTNDGFWDWDVASGHCYLSSRLLEMLGYQRGEWPDRIETLARLVHEDDRARMVQACDPSLFGDLERFRNEWKFLHRDGSVRHILCVGRVVHGDDGAPRRAIGSHTDVTELVETQERLRTLLDLSAKARDQAEAASRAKTAFLANMSHELRTPLNAIIGFAQILGTAPNLSPQQTDYVATIETAGRDLLEMIGSILEYSRIEAGHVEARPELFDAVSMAREALRAYEGEALSAGKTIDLIAASRKVPVRADQHMFRSILDNLLSNALKFTGPGGGVKVEVKADGGWVGIAVADTGIGVAPNDLGRLGQPFLTIGNPLTKQHRGVGLGLATVKALAALHGATMNVASELGRGTRVTVEFPAG